MSKLSAIMHFYDEELLMKEWVLHHKNILDDAILINHQSTDNSFEIIKQYAPSHWKVVDTKLDCFDAHKNDLEVMEWEETLQGWKICLNTTEFIWKHDIKKYLDETPHNVIGMKSFILVDDREREINPNESFLKQRHHGYRDDHHHRRWRYIHKMNNGAYGVGRHTTSHAAFHDPNLFLLYLSLSPYPQCLKRKLKIQNRIPESDKIQKLGWQHIITEQELRKIWEEAEKIDLLSYSEFKEQYNHFIK